MIIAVLYCMLLTLVFGEMTITDCESDRVFSISMLFFLVLIVQSVISLKLLWGVV